MNQSENIHSLKALLHDLQNLLTQTESETSLSAIELDLIKQKTREFYDKLLQLKIVDKKENMSGWKNVTDEKTIPQPTEAETAPASKPANLAQPDEDIPLKEPGEKKPDKEVIPIVKPSVSAEQKPENRPTDTRTAQEPNDATPLDLFSEPAAKSLGESLVKTEQPAVAEKLQKTQISDLREAIGINDKFLFINQLFHGDMNRYNKTLDELNSLSSIRGAQTFLIELSVQHQWDEESTAFVKLSKIIEMKFA